MSKKKSEISAEVLKALQRYQRDKDHELHDIAKKLAPDDPEKAQMWKYLEKVWGLKIRLVHAPPLRESPIPEYAHVGEWFFDIIELLNSKKCNQDEKKECASHLDYIRRCIATEPDHELYSISKKLTADNINFVKTWEPLLRGCTPQKGLGRNKDKLVNFFLSSVLFSTSIHPCNKLSTREQADLKDRLEALSREYVSLLKRYGLDRYVFYSDNETKPGWYSYETCYGEDRRCMRARNSPQERASSIVELVTNDACEMISDDPIQTKKGKRFHIVRFIRLMANHNISLYGFVLPSVIAKAANAIFPDKDNPLGTDYVRSILRKQTVPGFSLPIQHILDIHDKHMPLRPSAFPSKKTY